MIDRRGIILTNNHVVRGRAHADRLVQRRPPHEAVRATVVGTAAERDLAIIRVGLERSDAGAARALVAAAARRRRARDRLPARSRRRPDRHAGHRLRARPHGARRRRPRRSRACCRPTPRSTRATPAARSSTRAGRLVGINTVAAERRRERRLRDLDRRGASGDRRDPQQAGRQARVDRRHVRLDRLAQSAAVQIGLAPDTRGAAVIAVFAGSPASKAGLREGDVVVAVNGRPVRSAGGVRAGAARRSKPGDARRPRRRRPVGPAARHGDGRQAAGDAAGRLNGAP